jgi:hypothetical protein
MITEFGDAGETLLRIPLEWMLGRHIVRLRGGCNDPRFMFNGRL